MAKKNTSLWTILQTLVETPGPSGSEHVIREKIKAEISGHADEVYTDALGNLIARKGALKEGGKRIMISAHVDEIGLMITHVDDNGFARFLPIGGINPLTCLGGRVLFMNGTQGVIGMERLEKDEHPELPKYFIDTGATSKADSKVGVGDVLIGAAALAADYNGANKASHVKDKLIEMTHLNETLYCCGIACSAEGYPTQAGNYQIDMLLANVCKQNVTRLPYEIARLAQDIAGGLMVTMPSEKDLKHPVAGKYIDKYLRGVAAASVNTQASIEPLHLFLAEHWGVDDKEADLIRRALVLLADRPAHRAHQPTPAHHQRVGPDCYPRRPAPALLGRLLLSCRLRA